MMVPLCVPRQALTIGLFLALISPGFASPTLTDQQAAEARHLVRKLGSSSFRERDDASNRLVQMGSAVESILREGLASPDPEVQFRCRMILPLARSYDLEKRLTAFLDRKEDRDYPAPAGWEQFKEIAGDSRQSRELFAKMHRLDSSFLSLLEERSENLPSRMVAKCAEFAQAQNLRMSSAGPEQVGLLLFASLEPRVRMAPETQQTLGYALQALTSMPKGKETIKNNEVVRKLLLKYIADGSLCAEYTSLVLVSNLELKESVDFLKSFLKDKNRAQGYYRSMAIAVLGRVGGKSVAGDILPFMTDSEESCQSAFPNNVTIHTQTRDVALATLLQISGQKLSDYDFPFVKMNNRMNFGGQNSIFMWQYFGFSDDKSRKAAFAKWEEWYKQNKSTLAK